MPTPTLTVTAPSGAINTRKPTIVWVTNGFGDPQQYFQAKVFSAAQYTAGGFNPSTSASLWSSNLRNSASDTIDVSKPLPDGTMRAYVQVTTAGGTSAWAFVGFTLNDPSPSVPSAVIPVNGATVTTNRPTLGATLPATSLGARIKAEWQLATDAAFTSNVRDVVESNTDLRKSGATTEVTPASQSLFQGVWYIRARVVTEYGAVSSWSATQSFTVSHPPSATLVAPKGNNWALYGTGSVLLSWTFGDPSPDDYQTAYEVVVEKASDGTVVVDTGKVSSATTSTTVSIDSSLKSVLLRWKVRLWDSNDVVGSYSIYELFTVADAPTVTPIVPTHDQVFSTPLPNFQWDFVASGRVQAYYRIVVQKVSDSSVVFDSNWRAGADESLAITDPTSLKNSTSYRVYFYVRDNKGLEGASSETFSTLWTPPLSPHGVLVDGSRYDDLGFVMVVWDNTNLDGNYISYRVYVRETGTTTWTLVAETLDVDSYYMVPIYTLKSNVQYDIAVVQVASRFTANVESSYATSILTPDGTNYWLLDSVAMEPTILSSSTLPDQTDVVVSNSVRMYLVKEDSFDDQYEHEEFELIGRGRKEDIGTYWGHSGTLTAQIFPQDDFTPQEQRLQYETLKAQKSNVTLRTPFGDLWLVALGDIGFARRAGVGAEAMGDVTIPYVEVME